MSKKLDSIMNSLPFATASNTYKTDKINQQKKEEKFVRLNAVVPFSIKIQIKKYMFDHPGETEKTIILKGLKSLGFEISSKHLSDLRGKREEREL